MALTSAQSILDAIAGIENETKPAQEAAAAQVEADFKVQQAALKDAAAKGRKHSIGDMMKSAVASSHAQAIASHPDFPILAQDGGVQALVSALTNQAGKVLQGIKGSGHNPVTTLGD